jgi:hypothetical protein
MKSPITNGTPFAGAGAGARFADVVRAGVSVSNFGADDSGEAVVHRVVHVQELAYDRLAHEFTPERYAQRDAMLIVDSLVGTSRLRWVVGRPPRLDTRKYQDEL